MEMTDNWTEKDWARWEAFVNSEFSLCDSSNDHYSDSEKLWYSIHNYGGIFA